MGQAEDVVEFFTYRSLRLEEIIEKLRSLFLVVLQVPFHSLKSEKSSN